MTATLPAAPPSTGARAPSRTRRRTAAVVVVAVVLAVAAAWALARLAGGGTAAQTTVDRSTEPDGMRAFVVLLESFGADVGRGTVEGLAANPDVVLVLPGVELSPDEIDDVVAWAEGGSGTLVDAAGVLSGDGWWVDPAPTGAGGATLAPGQRCDVEAVVAVGRLEVLPTDVRVSTYDGAIPCFAAPDGPGSPVLVAVIDPRSGVGAGASIVVLGGVSAFTNQLLDKADNAVLATALFAPEPGTRVLLLHGDPGLPTARGVVEGGGGSGDGGMGGDRSDGGDDDGGGGDGSEAPEEDSLLDHIPVGVTMALTQLLVAFALYAWWRGRRVGAPVREPQPVDIEGSELVAAVGDLLARTGSPGRAAARLRADATRQLAGRLGLSVATDVEAVAAAVAARTGRPPESVTAVLAGPDPADGEALLGLAARLDALREEVLHGVRA